MFIPTTDKDREEMLKTIGASSIKDLLKQVPAKYLYPAFDLPETSLDEQQTARRMKALAAAGNRQRRNEEGPAERGAKPCECPFQCASPYPVPA